MSENRETLRLSFFTDLHCELREGVPESLEAAARSMRRSGAELFIGGGDFINEGIESCDTTADPRWELYRQFQSELGGRIEPVFGNHDLLALRPAAACNTAEDPRAAFRDLFAVERTYRTFRANGFQFFCLDSIIAAGPTEERTYVAGISSEQFLWLRAELDLLSERHPIIVVSHAPLLSLALGNAAAPGYALPAHLVVQNAKEVLELFAAKNLVAVLQGHLHVNETFRWRNTTFITGGAICGGWWKGPWCGTPAGYGVLTLRSGSAVWEYLEYPARSSSRSTL